MDGPTPGVSAKRLECPALPKRKGPSQVGWPFSYLARGARLLSVPPAERRVPCQPGQAAAQ